ncbi:hypothetical protein GCM10025787_02200 [Saccharopolyspora rosea]
MARFRTVRCRGGNDSGRVRHHPRRTRAAGQYVRRNAPPAHVVALLEVARTGSISGAAERLHVVTSAITQRCKWRDHSPKEKAAPAACRAPSGSRFEDRR